MPYNGLLRPCVRQHYVPHHIWINCLKRPTSSPRLFALNGPNHPFRVHPPQQTFSAQPLQLSNHPLSSPLKNLIQDPGSQSQPPLYYLFSAAEPDYLVVPFAVFLDYVDYWKGLLDAAYA